MWVQCCSQDWISANWLHFSVVFFFILRILVFFIVCASSCHPLLGRIRSQGQVLRSQSIVSSSRTVRPATRDRGNREIAPPRNFHKHVSLLGTTTNSNHLSIPGGGANVGDKNTGSRVLETTPHSISDPPRAPHVCCCYQMNQWNVMWWVQMDVWI